MLVTTKIRKPPYLLLFKIKNKCRRRLHSTHAHLHVTTLTHHDMTFTPGDAAACSLIPTVISPTYSDLTRCLSHTCHSFHTRARLENPSVPNPLSSLPFVRLWDRLTSTAGVSGPGFTPTSEHVAVSCAARPEPRARRRANPARFPIQLRPLLGLRLLSDAVVVSPQSTHTCVLRHSHTTT